ncbi:MAG: aminotransferase-like domain-containing protein, partial [Telluria sp.]
MKIENPNPIQWRFSERASQLQSSFIREILKITQRPEIISFAGGLPSPATFPVEHMKAAYDKVLSENGKVALQYGPTDGYAPLREWIADYLSTDSCKIVPEQVLMVSGSQQALDLIGKVLINPGDQILTETPTYLGALQAFTMYGADYVTVPVDDEGIDTGKLERALRAGPKFMYVLPNFQNPSGVTMSLPRRQELIALANHYGIPVVEDDPYGKLRFEGDHIKPLVVIDAEWHHSSHNGKYHGNLIYLSTFSKTLAPGLRLGWVVAPHDVILHLVQAKQGTDLHSSTFDQMVAYEVARDGFVDEHGRR